MVKRLIPWALVVSLVLASAGGAWAAPGTFTLLQVYYVFSAPTELYLVPVAVVVPATATPARRALEVLIQGPPPGSFLHAPLPTDTRILGLTISGGLATVDFSREITRVGGARSEALLLTAVTHTLAKFPGVERVQILVEGQRTSVGGHIDASDPIRPSLDGLFPRQVFVDTAGHWSEGNINALFLTGAIEGYGDGTFRPEQPITRAEFVKLLLLTAGYQQLHPAQPTFGDVPAGHWAYGYVQSAVANGILVPADYGANFSPGAQLTRREMAVLLTRARRQEQRAVQLRDAALPYTDAATFPAWARGYIGVATELGLMRGYPDQSFRPAEKALRSHVAAVLNRYLELGERNVRLVYPGPAAQVGAWVLVGGVARVFEATVLTRLLGPGGTEHAMAYTTATDGGPSWGIWAVMLPTPVSGSVQDLVVEAFTRSAMDGSVQDLVSHTVRRLP